MIEFKLTTAAFCDFAAYRNEITRPKGLFCIVHGVGEHFTRYQEFADTLGERGYSVYGMDLMGHGDSPGCRGDCGCRGKIWSQITALLSYAKSRAPGLPLFLMGHSMGGLLVLNYRRLFPDCGVDGFLVCSPWLGLTHSYSERDKAHFRALAEQDRFAVHNTEINPKKLFTKEKSRIIPKDPTMHPYIAYRNLLERLEDIEAVLSEAGQPRAPIYVFAGADDPICDVAMTRKFCALVGPDATLKVWDAMKHEPWNEPDRHLVVAELADWCDEICTQNQAAAV